MIDFAKNSGGTTDYAALENKPKINGHELVGDKSAAQLGLEKAKPFLSLSRICPFLYRVTFDSIPEFNGEIVPVAGACSAFVLNGKLRRTFDFKYDRTASFHIKTKEFEGMAYRAGLNDGEIDDTLVGQLPYTMVDGKNVNGIMASVHLLFNDWSYTGAGNKSIPLTRLPYEVLTRVKSMATIADDLAEVLGELSVPEAMGDYLLQMLITDGVTTYALIPPTTDGEDYELVDATDFPKMTNFRYVAREEVSRADMDLQDRPTGIERFNMMPCAVEELRFTKCYENADRLSEFIGIDGTTKSSTDEELSAIQAEAAAVYADRTRDGETWQTMHAVDYSSMYGMERLSVQERFGDNFSDNTGVLVENIKELVVAVGELGEEIIGVAAALDELNGEEI